MECRVNDIKKEEQRNKKENYLNFKEKHELDFFYLFHNYIIQDCKPKVYSVIDFTRSGSKKEKKKLNKHVGSAITQKRMEWTNLVIKNKKYTLLNEGNRVSFYFLDFFSFFYDYLWLTKTSFIQWKKDKNRLWFKDFTTTELSNTLSKQYILTTSLAPSYNLAARPLWNGGGGESVSPFWDTALTWKRVSPVLGQNTNHDAVFFNKFCAQLEKHNNLSSFFYKRDLKEKKKKISKEAPKKPEIKKKVKIKDIEVVGIKKKEQLSLLPWRKKCKDIKVQLQILQNISELSIKLFPKSTSFFIPDRSISFVKKNFDILPNSEKRIKKKKKTFLFTFLVEKPSLLGRLILKKGKKNLCRYIFI